MKDQYPDIYQEIARYVSDDFGNPQAVVGT